MDLVLNEHCLGFSCSQSAALAAQLGHRGVCGDKMKPPEGVGWVCGQGAAGAEISGCSCWFEGFLIAFFAVRSSDHLVLRQLRAYRGGVQQDKPGLEKQHSVWVKTAASTDVESNPVVRTGLGCELCPDCPFCLAFNY